MPKQESYNLQRVLEMRLRAQDEAAQYLAKCRQQLALAEEELENRQKAVENCRRAQIASQQNMIEKSRGGIKQTEMAIFRRHLADLREQEKELLDQVETQKQIVSRHHATVDKALEKLNEAAKETKVIETHREKWQTAKRIESNRREQKINDEIGAVLHGKQKFE